VRCNKRPWSCSFLLIKISHTEGSTLFISKYCNQICEPMPQGSLIGGADRNACQNSFRLLQLLFKTKRTKGIGARLPQCQRAYQSSPALKPEIFVSSFAPRSRSLPKLILIDATFARPGYKVIFDVFNVRNTLNEDPYYYWNHDPFFLGVACDMRSLREQSMDPNSIPKNSASVNEYMIKAVNALRNSLAQEHQVSDVNLTSIMLLALCEVGNML